MPHSDARAFCAELPDVHLCRYRAHLPPGRQIGSDYSELSVVLDAKEVLFARSLSSLAWSTRLTMAVSSWRSRMHLASVNEEVTT
jgi:hypothetical protein